MAYAKINFSRAALCALAAPDAGKRIYFGDTREPGLLLMVTGAGTKSFQLYMKHDGRPIRVTLGRFSHTLAESVEVPRDCSPSAFMATNPPLNVRMARDLAARFKIDIKGGINPTDVKRARREELTLGQMFEKYVDDHLITEGRKGIDGIRYNFERLLGALPDTPRKKHGRERVKTPGSVNWQNRRLSSISSTDVRKLLADLVRAGSTENANHALKILRSMYNRAIEWKIYTKANPCEGIDTFKTNSRERFLQPDELPRFFASIAMEPSKDVREFLWLSVLTGQRKANVLSMAWADINLERATWTVPGQLMKNGDPLTVALAPEAVTILTNRKPKKAATFVFPGTGASGHMEDPRKGWQRVLDRDEVVQLADRINAAGGIFQINFDDPAKPYFDHLAIALKKARKMAAEMEIDINGARLEDLRPHDLRRTLGSWQAITGASLPVIGKSLGHRSVVSTQIYAHLNLDPVREAVNTATRAILAVGARSKATVTPIAKANLKAKKVHAKA